MSLSDKYGGNGDIDNKYGVPKPQYDIDPDRCPIINPGYKNYYPKLLRDIRIEKELKSDYLNLLLDVKKYVNNNLYRTARDAFYNKKMDDFKVQVASMNNKYTLLATLALTQSTYSCGYDFDELVFDWDAEKEFKKYNLVSYDRQGFFKIIINTGTFISYNDDTRQDIDRASIYYFKDGNVYCEGSKSLHNVPIDYLSKVLDECITKLNNGNSPYYIPTMKANIYFENNSINYKNIWEQRQYILKRKIGYK